MRLSIVSQWLVRCKVAVEFCEASLRRFASGDSVCLQAGQPTPSFHLRVTSAFGEKHCIAVSALQEWPFDLQRQRTLLS